MHGSQFSTDRIKSRNKFLKETKCKTKILSYVRTERLKEQKKAP